jgi:ABC-type multidrug transport system ATPase subunit
MIVTRGLTKRYGRVLAVDHVDLEVRSGDRYGFLGPNGSGKTTLVRMLLGLVYATSGEIEMLGQPVPARLAKVLPHVGALVEAPSAYGHLSGRANLALLDASGPRAAPAGGRTARGRRSRRRRIEEALGRVGLAGIDNRAVSKYSLGMKQRLGLAAALLRGPRLLVLDEPTNGLDPRGIREVRDLLTELNEAGTTVFLSSHQLAEVELLCTRVGVIDRGRLVLQDDLDALRGPTGRAIVCSPDADRVATLLAGRVAYRDDDRLIVTGADPAELNTELVLAGLRVSEVRAERRSLEELVLSVTTAGSDRLDRAPASPGTDGIQPQGADGSQPPETDGIQPAPAPGLADDRG